MSTTVNHVPEDSTDVAGLSRLLTTRSIAHPEQGNVYDPMNFAAITPVHVHSTRPGRYLVLFSRRVHTAIISGTDPGSYTAYNVDSSPGWVMVDVNGSRKMASSESYLIPGPAGRVLTAACSRANTYLYALSSLGASGSIIQHFRWSEDQDIMVPVAEEILPVITLSGEQVRFDAGVYLYGDDIVVVGRGLTTNSLYLARKGWGRIGITTEGYQGNRNEATRIDDPSWRYATVNGWSADPSELAPLPVASAGPVSVVVRDDRLIVAIVKADGTTRTAEVWYSRHVSPTWHKMSFTAPLGVEGVSYLGGTLQMQPELIANTSGVAITALTAVAQDLLTFPYSFPAEFLPVKINVTWTQVPVIS
jgi:hypothetical protein